MESLQPHPTTEEGSDNKVPKAGELGSRENSKIMPRTGNEYGGYTGDRIPELDPRVIDNQGQNAILQAAAERVMGKKQA